MSAIAGHLLDDLAGGLLHPAQAGSDTEQIILDMDNRFHAVAELLSAMLWVLGQVQGAWRFVQPLAEGVGKDWEQLAGEYDATFTHLTDTVIPRSLAHAVGYVFSTGIVPLRQQLRKVDSQLRFLMGWRGQIDTWRKHTVDPAITDWRQFHHWFDHNAAPIIATVDGWLKHPDRFAKWAVPILGDPLTVWFVNQAKRSTQDAVAAVLADRSPDVWRHVEAAAAAILNVEV